MGADAINTSIYKEPSCQEKLIAFILAENLK